MNQKNCKFINFKIIIYSDSSHATPKDLKKPLLVRFKHWLRKFAYNTKEFLLDIIKLDGQKIYKKFSNFVVRNHARIMRTSHHIWHELKLVGKGFKTFKRDIQESVSDTKDMHDSKFKKVTYSQTVKMQKVRRDVIKFIPFSLFIIVPGLELLLPAWLVIFPNSIPSQFQSESARRKKLEKLLENRDLAAEKLLYKFPKYFNKVEKSNHLTEVEKEQLKELLRLTRNSKDIMVTNLLQYKHLFKKYADFRHFKVSTLQQMGYFMGLDPVTGVNTINNLLSFFGLKIDISSPYVKWFTKMIMIRELRLFFRKIRREDAYLSMEKMSNFEEYKIDSILIERGIEIENKTKKHKLNDYKLWQTVSNLNNVPDTMLVYFRLNQFAEDLYRTNYYEQEYDLMRAIASNNLHEQRKKMLDEYLGVSEVKRCLQHFATFKGIFPKEEESLPVSEGQNSEVAEEKKVEKPKLNFEDYERYKKAVKGFKNRHHSVIDEVELLSKENEKILNELETQVILGFIDRQEQNILLEKYKDLYNHHKLTSPNPLNLKPSDSSSSELNTKAEIEKLQKLLNLNKDPTLESPLPKIAAQPKDYLSQ